MRRKVRTIRYRFYWKFPLYSAIVPESSSLPGDHSSVRKPFLHSSNHPQHSCKSQTPWLGPFGRRSTRGGLQGSNCNNVDREYFTLSFPMAGSPGQLAARRPRHQEGGPAAQHGRAGQLGQAEEAPRRSEESGSDCGYCQVRTLSGQHPTPNTSN